MNNKVRTAIIMWTLGTLVPSASYSQQQQPVVEPNIGQPVPAQAALLQGANDEGESGGWNIIPFVTLTETYTDDADIDSVISESDVVSQLTIGTTIDRTGPRFNLALEYGLTYLYYPGLQGDKDEFRHELQANSQTEIVNDFLFFDLNAGVAQTYVDPRQAFSAIEIARTDNRATVAIINASPYVLRRIGGNFATVETRYEYTYIDTSQFSTFDGINLGDTFASETHAASINFNSGTRFSKFIWGWENIYSQERRTFGNANNLFSSVVTGEYKLNRSFALIGEAGYTRRESDFFDRTFKGLVWRVGGRLTPGPRTVIEATYGKEFFGETVNVDASYQITESIVLSGSYNDRFDSFRSLFVDDFLNGPANNPVDQVLNPIANEFVRFKTASVSVVGARGRSTISFLLDYAETSSSGGQQLLNTTRKTAGVIWTRRMSPRLTFTAGATFLEEVFQFQPGKDHFTSYEGRFDYLISENITGSIEYVHTDRDQRFFGFTQRGSNYVSLILGATF